MNRDSDRFRVAMLKFWGRCNSRIPEWNNALIYARHLGAVVEKDVYHSDVWFEKEDDAPAHLLRFPDGSYYVVSAEGWWIKRPMTGGRKPKPLWRERVA